MLRHILLLILVVVGTQAFSQTEEGEKKKDFTKIKQGMNEAQVKKLVGNPEFVEKFKTLKKGTTDTTTYWRYENDLTIIFKNHYVEEIERDHNQLLQRIQEWADPKNRDGIKLLYK
jgi:hypothetical protein